MLKIHQIVTLLPVLLYVTQQQLGRATALPGVPVVTLPLVGMFIVAVYGYQKGEDTYAIKLALAALVFLLVPIALSVVIDGGGPMQLGRRLVLALTGINI